MFTPDRLAVVKSGPAARRAYFDRVLARLLPARADLPGAYAEALGQRNAALRRVGLGLSDTAALDPWTDRVASLAAELVEARRLTVEQLSPAFEERAGELGLPAASVGYAAEAPTRTTSTAGSPATSSAARRASARTSTSSASSRGTAISAPSVRRASSASRCSRSSWPRPSS